MNSETSSLHSASSPTSRRGSVESFSSMEATFDNPKHMAERIASILEQYRIDHEGKHPGAASAPVRSGVNWDNIYESVRGGRRIHAVLPAFPFKSPNRVDKVLGALPDKGEEFGLARLNGMCADICDVYPPGAEVTIVSDGLVYNDILGIPEEEVWDYGQALREMARKKCPHISFARLKRLIRDPNCIEATTKGEYVHRAPQYREQLIKENLPAGFDVQKLLKEEPDALTTYRGYIQFLGTDLKHADPSCTLSRKSTKRRNEVIAKKMMERGRAFANAIRTAFPFSLRLSIHPSLNTTKLSISLLPTPSSGTHCPTPWHCTPTFSLTGNATFAHRINLHGSGEQELVYSPIDGQALFYRERKPELYHWPRLAVHIEPIYPCGLMITPAGLSTDFSLAEMKAIRTLAELNSPVILRGFTNTNSRPLFVRKAREMGKIMPWKFGEVLEVKDAGGEGKGLNNVLSAEPMPMHFDGLFKVEKELQEDGEERLVPKPPRFQVFTCISTPPPGDKNAGFTLFASSRLLLANLPAPYTVDALKGLTWACQTPSFDQAHLTKLPLIQPHPSLAVPCLRYHEDWPSSRTNFDPTRVQLEPRDAKLMGVLDGLLYDRRVCYYHEWRKGDVLVSDNVAMMHTRTAFRAGCDRELWRIHVD